MGKYLKYFKYLCKYKYYVMKECFRLGIPLRGILHDMSKFRPTEFFISAEYFYGEKKPVRLCFHPQAFKYDVYTQDDLQNHFDISWLKHQHRNKHHWQYWVLRYDNGKETCLDMPIVYIKEMIADWVGSGKLIHGENNGGYEEALEFYKKNMNKIKLSRMAKMHLVHILDEQINKNKN